MEIETPTQTAKIYQFPVSRIRRLATSSDDATAEQPRQHVYDVSFADAWYHQEAIETPAG